MADFLTRLAERSLGLSPVMQPAIAPRFGSVPTMPDEVDRMQFAEHQANAPEMNAPEMNGEYRRDRSSIPVRSDPLENQPFSPIFSGQEQLSTLEPDTAINPIQGQALSDIHQALSLPNQLPNQLSNQLSQPSSTLPEPNAQQPTLSAANSIAPDRLIREESSQSTSLEPFRVLRLHERISVESHPSLAIAQSRSETLIAPSEIPADSSSQQNPLVPGVVSEAPADRESSPPTIRVSIGRVEVRAIMPTAPPSKISPTRSRPAVSLNEYLKQRQGKL